MNFSYLKGSCQVCGGARKDCRKTDTGVVHCRSGNTAPPGWEYLGEDSIGFGRYRDPENTQQQSGSEISLVASALSLDDRHVGYAKLLNALPQRLNKADLADLQKRGITTEQITRWQIRSIDQWQKLDQSIEFAVAGLGQDGKSLSNGHAGYLFPIRDPYGRITGCQIRNRDTSDDNKYPWFTSRNKRYPQGVTPHLSNGELPITVAWPSALAPDKVGTIGLCEGTGVKPHLAAERLGIPVIGASGGHWANSPKTLIDYITQIQEILCQSSDAALPPLSAMELWTPSQSLNSTDRAMAPFASPIEGGTNTAAQALMSQNAGEPGLMSKTDTPNGQRLLTQTGSGLNLNLCLLPDAGSLSNKQVLADYEKTISLLVKQGYSVNVVWWNQFAKADGDIDEASALAKRMDGQIFGTTVAWRHAQTAPCEVIVCESRMRAFAIAVRLWHMGRTGYLTIGVEDFQLDAQATLKAIQHNGVTSVLLAPSPDSDHAAYDRLHNLLSEVEVELNVLWWGQDKHKTFITDLDDRALKNLEIITWEEFQSFKPPESAQAQVPQPPPKRTNAQILEQVIERCSIWQTDDNKGWIDVPVGSHTESMPIASPRFKGWLSKEFHAITGRHCGQDAMNQVLLRLSGEAYEAPIYEIHHRVAKIGDKVYLDLGRQDWKIVEICGAGWRIVEGDCPAKFWRPSSMKPMPLPSEQGDWTGLRKILNLEEKDWVLLLSWLSFGLYPERPHPLLILNGEQGTGKSKTSELLKRLIDPAKALLMSMPREERNLKAHAHNRWALVYDNLSGLSTDMSDALCRLATGGGLVDRSLYTDMDESVFDGVRPVILNGIEALATRPDLLERSILLNLQPISDEARITEAEWEATLASCQAAVLGSLLNGVSQGLRTRDNVKVFSLPRMADFAVWGHATETAFGFGPGTFEEAYAANRGLVHQAAIDNDAIAAAILQLCEIRNFSGTASELLKELSDIVSEEQRRAPDWIKSPRVLGRRLVRLAPELRKCGVQVRTGIRVAGQRIITLEAMPHEEPAPTTEAEEITYEYQVPEAEPDPPKQGETVTYRNSQDNWQFTLVSIDGESCTIERPGPDGKPIRYTTRLDWLERIDTPLAEAG